MSKEKKSGLGKAQVDQSTRMVIIAIAAITFSSGPSTPVADDTAGDQTRQPRQRRSGCGGARQGDHTASRMATHGGESVRM